MGDAVLNEKKVSFQLAEVALKDPNTGLWHQLENKPAWFTRLNPLGKARSAQASPEACNSVWRVLTRLDLQVPVLAHKDASGNVRSVYEVRAGHASLDQCVSRKRLSATTSDSMRSLSCCCRV